MPASDIPSVRVGQEVDFQVEGFGERSFSGNVERINPSTEGVVTWVSSVAEGQEGLPGGLRAAIQDDYVPPPGSVATAAGSAEEASP